MTRRNRAGDDKKSRQRRERRQAFADHIPKAKKRTIGRSTTRETPLHLRVRGLDADDEMHAYVHSRVGFKLGKHALGLTRITVRIENVAGPKGAPTYSCRFKVILPNKREVVVAATATSAREAFDDAADATERAVRRLLGRGRDPYARRASAPVAG